MPPKKKDSTPEPTLYSFEHDGKSYALPAAETAANKVPGRFLRDALMDGEAGELRLAIATLEQVDAPKGALDALYEKPPAEMIQIITEWMRYKDDEAESSLGESSRSSS